MPRVRPRANSRNQSPKGSPEKVGSSEMLARRGAAATYIRVQGVAVGKSCPSFHERTPKKWSAPSLRMPLTLASAGENNRSIAGPANLCPTGDRRTPGSVSSSGHCHLRESIDTTERLAIDFPLCPSEHLIWLQNLGACLFGRPRTGNEIDQILARQRSFS